MAGDDPGRGALVLHPLGLAILFPGPGLGPSMFMVSKMVCCHGLSDGTRGTVTACCAGHPALRAHLCLAPSSLRVVNQT